MAEYWHLHVRLSDTTKLQMRQYVFLPHRLYIMCFFHFKSQVLIP